MPGPDQSESEAEAANMTDEELIDTWKTASVAETKHLSPLLRAVVDEMERRGIAL
ncbi:MAG TPA: hypothetical protein VJM09_13250 [Sphingobium sp.]|nr:hypothetical protein [Sphingobium sp.]